MEEEYVNKILTAELEDSFLQRKQMELDSLLEVTNAINRNASERDLFQIYGFILKAQMQIDRLIIFYCKEGAWDKVHSVGNIDDEHTGTSSILPSWYDEKKVRFFESSNNILPKGFQVLLPVFHKERPLAFVLLSELKVEMGEELESKVTFIKTITNIIIVAIENKRLFRKQLRQLQLGKEMELAKKMQTMLIPQKLPNDKTINLSAIYMPHFNIGGDYYDVLPIGEHKLLSCIADVSGKGISAALLMANFQALLRVLGKESKTLSELVEKINENVVEITQGDRFITFFVAMYDRQSRNLTYVNAGHPPPILFDGSNITKLNYGSTIIGAFDKLPQIEVKSLNIRKNSLLVMYTDGLTELTNQRGVFFDEVLLEDFILSKSFVNSSKFNEALLSKLIKFKQNRPFTDDITILSWKFN